MACGRSLEKGVAQTSTGGMSTTVVLLIGVSVERRVRRKSAEDDVKNHFSMVVFIKFCPIRTLREAGHTKTSRSSLVADPTHWRAYFR